MNACVALPRRLFSHTEAAGLIWPIFSGKRG